MKFNHIDGGNFALMSNIRKELDFFENYPLTQNDLINLCGGVPSQTVEFVSLEASPKSNTSIRVEIVTNLYDCCRTFDFDHMEIDNNGLHVYKPGYWVGTTLFLNQVKEARKYGFSSISLTAEGPDRDHNYTGHYKWGRVGFKMSKYEISDFHIWAANLKRQEYDLGELLLTEEGCRLWKLAGYTWHGKFDLTDGSDCMDYLEDYLERENISFKLYD